ncbi:MAG: YbhB/YbcL family Raf kinase inhibitor-like protein [Candidatus Liptonbacteria bacterium]|nr:YbhB/YbcL family Raf kinase inhibitor-like protein [Candidatus Liptonbacteria bacterium]
MTITSPSFRENGSIPKKFTCQGENINPELRFGGAPEEAKSLALIMHDPDAPMPGGFTHWVMWNIEPLTTAIKENSAPPGASEGKNGAGKTGYIGPCPPSGTHRYFFKLYALDAVLNLPAGADKNSLEAEINKHLLAEAEIIGLYQR